MPTKQDKKQLFKIEAKGAFGKYYFVMDVSEANDLKKAFYHKMPPTETPIGTASKTTKKFIEGVKPVGSVQPYWIVVP